jgi:P-type Cu+ transporter
MTTFKGRATAIHCEGCANSIKRSLGKLPGVEEANVDISSKMVSVLYEPSEVTEEAIRTRLEAAGFPVENA